MNQISLSILELDAGLKQLLIDQLNSWKMELPIQAAGAATVLATLLSMLIECIEKVAVIEILAQLQRITECSVSCDVAPALSAAMQDTLQQVQQQRAVARSKNSYPGRRKLDYYHQEILQLLAAGASQRDIRWWLKREKRCLVSQSTISRYLRTRQ